MRIIAVLIGLIVLFTVCPAHAADFSAVKKGLPSLVMLSTQT